MLIRRLRLPVGEARQAACPEEPKPKDETSTSEVPVKRKFFSLRRLWNPGSTAQIVRPVQPYSHP